jgi:hypothetical protein
MRQCNFFLTILVFPIKTNAKIVTTLHLDFAGEDFEVSVGCFMDFWAGNDCKGLAVTCEAGIPRFLKYS